MIIDIVSVILVIALCGLFLCIALALAVDCENPEPGTRWWIGAFAALSAGFSLNGFRRLLVLLGAALQLDVAVLGRKGREWHPRIGVDLAEINDGGA